MQPLLKLSIVLLSLPLFFFGAIALFDPLGATVFFDLYPKHIDGLSSIRSGLGGLLVGIATMMNLAAFKSDKYWARSVLLIMAMLVLGRLLGLFFDGAGGDVLKPFSIEVLIIIVMSLAVRQLSVSKPKKKRSKK